MPSTIFTNGDEHIDITHHSVCRIVCAGRYCSHLTKALTRVADNESQLVRIFSPTLLHSVFFVQVQRFRCSCLLNFLVKRQHFDVNGLWSVSTILGPASTHGSAKHAAWSM